MNKSFKNLPPSPKETEGPQAPRYRQIFEKLAHAILTGAYQPGQKLPSEAALVRQFRTSRITVGRAVRELKERGLVERIAGSGTYVRARAASRGAALFGLLIPGLGETEIFEPICQGMAGASGASPYALLWGSTQTAQKSIGESAAESVGDKKDEQALSLCRQFIERSVSGVFFAPLELTPAKDQTNQAIAAALEKARIPVVLLDRCILPFPKRSKHDLVGIDNRRAGYLATEHLLKLGCRRIVFIGYIHGAPTVAARITGFREAMQAYGAPVDAHSVQLLASPAEIKWQRLDGLRAEAFVCVNDGVAGRLMHAVLAAGRRIPQDVRIVGMDDVEYAKLLPVPLTTIRQPCRDIGAAAIATMLDRIAQPRMLPRDILLDCRLVVRASCGATL